MRLPDRDDFHNQIILDYNPTNPHSWVRDLETAKLPGGVDLFTSTFYDNPFIGEKQIKLYEMWKETNWNKWLVFGMGEYGEIAGAIYTNWDYCDVFPEDVEKFWYGLDFGFTNDPTTLIKVGIQGGEIYVDELIYERGMTNQDIARRLRELRINPNDDIICDSAEPKSIEEIKRERFRAVPAKKGPGSKLNGIDILQRYKINITNRSKNIIDEIINYTWKKSRNNSEFINTPVDDWDHALDALRYVALNKLNTKPKGSGIIFKRV